MPAFPSAFSRSLVSDEFNRLCVQKRVEAKVQAYPNPGDPLRSVRLITFKNFNNEPITIFQNNRKKTRTVIPPNGEAEIMVMSGEELPDIEHGVINA